ncbi:CD5 antigen-like [Merluccius polli]|nr:CD5 antigen-like [Merluccius polli]
MNKHQRQRLTCEPPGTTTAGSLKARLAVSRDHCFGNVEMFSQGQWRPVCKDALDKSAEAQAAICTELNCGKSVESLDFFGPLSSVKQFVSKLSCPTGSNSLASCTTTVSEKSCPKGGLKCSDWKRLVLKSKEGGRACEGMVFMYSKDDPKVVSSQGWTQEEGQRLCQDLGCGSYQNHSEEEPDGLTMWGTFNCSGVDKPGNIWECMRSEQATVNKRLYLQCQEDKFKVSLSEGCRGQVLLDKQKVCSRHWKPEDSHRVCMQTNCNNSFIEDKETEKKAAGVTALHVNCLGSEGQLGQCMVSSATCENPLVSVFCIGAIKFNTTEKCGGRIQVLDRDGNWEMICPLTAVNGK